MWKIFQDRVLIENSKMPTLCLYDDISCSVCVCVCVCVCVFL